MKLYGIYCIRYIRILLFMSNMHVINTTGLLLIIMPEAFILRGHCCMRIVYCIYTCYLQDNDCNVVLQMLTICF